MGTESVPRREVVTGRPHTPGGGRTVPPPVPAPAPGPAHPDADAVRALMRRQLRAALTATALLAAPLGLLPVLLRVLPLADSEPRVPPALWLLLGVAPYPALLGIGAWYVRRAERNETGTPAPAERP
ncbi:hypothetical protein D9753_04275 [Streptomyces dangxiongensis]|uniref:DUF485 domain-containing protein n=1 Tax=Streptomyces dangxiongensis TaxID=1442032 RepID=A0A3G2JBZ8_9ACTN|nr:hypothetical protein [Streptomyces dangxiongensis]AYN38269.1 hypothetical protein D9753_04275 [Streptomyces dangxiongensis]